MKNDGLTAEEENHEKRDCKSPFLSSGMRTGLQRTLKELSIRRLRMLFKFPIGTLLSQGSSRISSVVCLVQIVWCAIKSQWKGSLW